MGAFFKEFKNFAMRGNVVDMAVGIIVGAAFSKIVSSVVADLFMPVIGLLVGGMNFTDFSLTLKEAVMDGDTVVEPAVVLAYGNFLQVVFDFMIIAFCMFLFVRMLNQVIKKREEEKPKPAPAADVVLLEEIRDLLKKQTEKEDR
ncbi:MAG: large-conductance mechanosensitive channel protein MscL [Rikenellaceae bacterium]|nr:large-conductance mechanosensitive channel protein MscL [Rikenellaceae bacterium]MDE7356660.1 large-conductance mechanosensitive channel protein MscL [Rikenellaceae bacterium]